jgi:type IV fimbrial biogenesis protein FimT
MCSRVRGFTLIELMVVISLAAVMLGLALPSFKSFVAGQRVKTATSDFSLAAVFARSEAIKRNAEVGIVAAAGGWKDGWSVKFGAVTLGTQSAYKGLVMTPSHVDVIDVVYLGSGRLKTQAHIPGLQVSDEGGTASRCVSFDLSGLPKRKLGDC